MCLLDLLDKSFMDKLCFRCPKTNGHAAIVRFLKESKQGENDYESSYPVQPSSEYEL